MLAAEWRRRLAHGPPPVEEPDFEDPVGWDRVSISYAPRRPARVIASGGVALFLATGGVAAIVAALT